MEIEKNQLLNIWIFAPKVALNLPILESISAKDTLCFFLILVIKGDANWNLTIAIFFRLRRQMASLPMSSLKATCSNLRMNLGGIASSLSPKYCFNAYSKEFVSLCTTLQIASVIKIWNSFLKYYQVALPQSSLSKNDLKWPQRSWKSTWGVRNLGTKEIRD